MSTSSVKLFGRSDIHHISVAGEEIVAKRHKHPQPWNPDRTVALIEHDDPKVIAALMDSGWSVDPRKVGWTPDEEEARQAMKEEGDVLTSQMARSFADAAVSTVAQARSGASQGLPQAFLDSLTPEQRALLTGSAVHEPRPAAASTDRRPRRGARR
ncbi:MAG: hypothetical protein ACRENL_11440 [Candidatus Dormibacteria bacterium]